MILFSLNEFGFDRFHRDYKSVYRILQRNNSKSYSGNRLSNRIPLKVYADIKQRYGDSMIVSRVKLMEELSIITPEQNYDNEKLYAADEEITNIFSFNIVDGFLKEFHDSKQAVILSSSTAIKYFGTWKASGKTFKMHSLGDTLLYSVAAVYKDYPQNSHEDFKSFIRFDTVSIRSLYFNHNESAIYARIFQGDVALQAGQLNARFQEEPDITSEFQRVSEIYFGPRVLGESSKHGDHYSIIILLCITGLILFLALTTFINLTTLTLPYRVKELAVKKLAGTSQLNLLLTFARESFSIVGISLVFAGLILALTSDFIGPILALDLFSLFIGSYVRWVLITGALSLILGLAPLFITLKFIQASPIRLLSTDSITFPRFKRIITFLQLGISIFLIVASMVIRRQIDYSLIKEPGRNHDQVVYMRYPPDLTHEGLYNIRANWKKNTANILDVMATSQLPDRITSKEVGSDFYFMSVDPEFKDFFDLKIKQGNWFKPNAGDSIVVVNERGLSHLGENRHNVIGVFEDISGRFNRPEKPTKVNIIPYFKYNFLCVRILEVDIRRTVNFLSTYFHQGESTTPVYFFNRSFEDWLVYQDRLNTLTKILSVISGILSCCAIYGLSVSLVRDKLKSIAIHKLCGASTLNITRLLIREFTNQMLLAILIFGPLSYIIIKEVLRSFAYATHFIWLDPFVPLVYCGIVITLLCSFQALSLNREDLSSSLKG